MIMKGEWIVALVFLILGLKTCSCSTPILCDTIDSLKLGCFAEKLTNREFTVLAGDYNASLLSPERCVRLCGQLSFPYTALQNGDLCLCGSAYGTYGAASTCNVNCTGDVSYTCGGKEANTVYNSTVLVGHFALNKPSKYLQLFVQASITAVFINGTINDPGLSIDISEESGYSTQKSISLPFSFTPTRWGTKRLTAVNSLSGALKTAYSDIQVVSPVKYVDISCPKYVKTQSEFQCTVKVYQGTKMQAAWQLEEDFGNLSLPDPAYHGVGPPVPQWTVSNITSLHTSGVFLIPSSLFTHDAMVLGLEIYGHAAGNIKIFVARRTCALDDKYYCIKNSSCISVEDKCTLDSKQQCPAAQLLNVSSSKCQNPLVCGSSVLPSLVYPQSHSSVNHSVICDFGSVPIQVGYNIFVIPENNPCRVQKGDILGWVIEGSGLIGHRSGANKARKYEISSSQIKKGYNFSLGDSYTEISVEYLLRAVSAEASTFLTRHVIKKSGVMYYHANVTNNVTSLPVGRLREIRIQEPVMSILAAYPEGFDYFGTRKNIPVELALNISVATNLTVILTNSSSKERYHTYVDDKNHEGLFFVYKVNLSFPEDGFFKVYAEAFNEISSVNKTVRLLVGGEITGLTGSLSQPDKPVYQGLQTSLWARVDTGPLVRYKWIIENNYSAVFVNSNETLQTFKKVGVTNVTVIASNQVFSASTSFSILVLNPLSLSIPDWAAATASVTLNCTLKGNFAPYQRYIWDFGDGTKFDKPNATSVQHTFSKGGNTNITCKIDHLAPIIATSSIFILESVSGQCLKPFAGVELFDNKTFVAVYSTGNNLTFSWAIQGETVSSLAVCSTKTFPYYFQFHGTYTITLNISNAISFISCTRQFLVEEKISNISISVFPNPAPSNTSVTFKIFKGAGNNVTYTVNFSDGYLIRNFDGPLLEFNRTFTAGKWQIVLTAANTVSNEIIFCNLTVQDVVKHLSIDVDADGRSESGIYVAVDKTKILRSQAEQGTDLRFTWMINDEVYHDKGISNSGKTHVSRNQTFIKEGKIVVNVTARNLVSKLSHSITFYAQKAIKRFDFSVPLCVASGKAFEVRLDREGGGGVKYNVSFGDGSADIITKRSSISKTYFQKTKYIMIATAFNQIGRVSISKEISVQFRIKDLTCGTFDKVVPIGSQTRVFWRISNGSDVTYFVNYGDGSPEVNVTSQLLGQEISLNYTYSEAKRYHVTVKASNLLAQTSCNIKAIVEEPIRGLNITSQVDLDVEIYKEVSITANVTQGSQVTYVFDFGDGLGPVSSNDGVATHKYRYAGKFTPNITAKNLLSYASVLASPFKATAPKTQQRLRGLKISAAPTIYGVSTTIKIIWDEGAHFECTLNYGEKDDSTEKLTYDKLGPPVSYTYAKIGHFRLSINCINKYSVVSATGIAKVEKPIVGLNFTSLKSFPNIVRAFGESFKIQWGWTKGSFVTCFVEIFARGKKLNSIKNLDKSVVFKPEHFEKPGTYEMTVHAVNAVTKEQTISLTVTLIQPITYPQLLVNPYVQVDFPAMAFLVMQTGTHAISVWSYGEAGKTVVIESLSTNRYIRFQHKFSKSGVYTINVTVWNQFSAGNATVSSTVSVLNPVVGFSIAPQYTLQWPENTVTFRFHRNQTLPPPSNASYQIEFGDNSTSEKLELDSSQCDFNLTHAYENPGCYVTTLMIFNIASYVRLVTRVSIIQKVENLTIEALHSQKSSTPRKYGWGRDRNILPLEYPVTLHAKLHGTCATYKWNFGDEIESKLETIATINHAYTLPGNYTVRVKAFNSISSKEYSSNIIILRSVVGLYLISNSPVNPGRAVTFIIFCAQPGNNTHFVLETGENTTITVPFPKRGAGKEPMKTFSPNIRPPFNVQSYYASTVNHTYTKTRSKSVYEARVSAWNNASFKSAQTKVVVTELDCSVPHVETYGGGSTLETALPFKFDRSFRINSRVNFSCNAQVEASFQWNVFRADTYYSRNSSMPPEEDRKISLPDHVIQNQSFITVPKRSLKPGYYLLQLTVTLSEVPLTNTGQQYVRISTPSVEAKIEGGSARSRGWEVETVLDASKSYDPLDPDGSLRYEWYCEIKSDFGIIGKGGCFGRGEGLVESTEPVFRIRAKSLLESVVYSFSVKVTPQDEKRAVIVVQRITIVQGKPPDINIKCRYNCGGKVTADKRFAIEAYCTDCMNDTALEYTWTSYRRIDGRYVTYDIWPNRNLTNRDSKYVVVKEEAFEQDATYMLKVEAKRKGAGAGASAFAEYNFTTNSPPKNGRCDITPAEGMELETSFYVTCDKWEEEDTPLSYEILVKNNGNQSSSKYTLMWYGPELKDSKVILTAGEMENNYTLDLIVRVRDVYGAVNDTNFKRKVEPLSGEISSRRLLGFTGELHKSLARGDVMGAFQLTAVLGSIINKQPDIPSTENGMTIQDKTLVRSNLTISMDRVVPRDIQAVRQLSGSLELVAREPEQLSIEAQESSLSIYKRAVDVVFNSAKEEEPMQIEVASQRSLSTIGSFITAASMKSKKLFSDPSSNAVDLHKAQVVSNGLVDLTNKLANATLVNKLAGEKETLYTTKYLKLAVKKIQADDLSNADIKAGGNGRFVLPGEKDVLNGIGVDPEDVSIAVSEMGINPFSGTNSSLMVKSSAMSLILMGENSQQLKIEGLSSPIDIFLQNERLEQKELNKSTTPQKSNTMTIHRIKLDRAENAIIADIKPENKSALFNVYFRYNSRPTLTEYDILETFPSYPINETTNITSPGPFTFFASSGRTNGSGYYYIGVMPADSYGNVTQEPHNYTFDVFSSGCYFWSESKKIWMSEGCKVGNKTSRSMTHCQCTHLTWFGGDLFIPPNKIDLAEDIHNFKNLHESPALLATVCFVVAMYVITLVFARRRDKKDTIKSGLISVPDNDPNDRFRYEVTVYTGRMGRSTTSNISIILYGELAESHPITLIDKERPVFESGSVDSFFVTVPEALGPLNYMRIWHDNSGSWPAWYLNQVIIRDIDTDERFVFLCYRWFACDEDDGQVERILPIAGKEELREFTYLFRNRAKKDFSDAHLWFSIALRPPRSRFTRVQRASCCLSLLLCTMLANVMWYDVPQKKNNTVIFESGFIRITWHSVVVGIYSSLIVFPINLLIAQIFRSLERRPKKRRNPEDEKGEEAKDLQKSVVKLNDIHAITRPDSTFLIHQSKANEFATKKKAFAPQEAYDDDDLLCLLMENRLLDEHQLRQTADSRLNTPIMIAGTFDVMKGGVQPFDQEDIRKKASISPVSECSLDYNDSSQLVKPEKPKHDPIKIKVPKPKFLLPWWFVFVGWFFCITTSLVAAFFTLLNGLKFKREVQEEWLIAMLISLIQDIFISQPLKVIGFALFFALILKKPDKSDESLNAELAKDEEWLKQNMRGQRRNALIAEQPKYMAPDEAMLKKARIRRFKERKMYSVIREIVMYAVFVWVVLLIAYGHKDPDANSLNQGIENMLTGTGNSWLVDYKPKKAKNETRRKFLKVSGIEKFWKWTNNTLLPSLYNGPWYNGKKDIDGYMADRTSWLIGVARLRQLRVKTDTCQVAKVFQGFLGDCNEPYSWDSEETTRQFRPGWLPALPNFTTPNRAWQYRKSVELKSLPFLGRLAFYSGGGYAEDLGPTVEEARRKIQELESENWIDKQTRAVFVEVTIYNPHTNIHCVAFLVLEVSASGGAFPFVELLVTRIDRYTGQFKLFVLIFEIAFVFFTLFFTYKLIKGMLNIGPVYYLKEYWNWVELILVAFSWTSIVLYFARLSINILTQREYRGNPQQFVNFHPLAASDQLFGYIYAFVVFLVSLKFLRLFRFNRRMSLLASTLKNSSKELMCFSIVFGIVFMAFVHFCYLVFSTDLYMFHTVLSSVETLISVMLGKFSYERLLDTNRVLAPVMFFFYSFLVVWVLINMFISIIIENFQEVKHNNDLQSNEYEIVDFMTDQFRVWLGWSTWGFIFSSKNKVRDYPMGKPKYKKRRRVMQAENLKHRVDRLVTMIQTVYFEKDDFLRNDGEVTYGTTENAYYYYY